MNRRNFLKKTFESGVVAGSALALGDYSNLLAVPQTSASAYDLVTVMGGEPEVMFDKAIASLGGIDKFVSRGSKVLIKPNIGWDVPPERGGNTNPKLVSRIIEHCLNAGAKAVSVFDHTCDQWLRCIADFASFRKPTLTVVDAYRVMKRNGPRGVSAGDIVTMKSQIVSTDLVAADAAAVKFFGSEPEDIRHIELADQLNLGRMDLSGLSINRIKR
jgi:uncharacterized protein (DUF362 family)